MRGTEGRDIFWKVALAAGLAKEEPEYEVLELDGVVRIGDLVDAYESDGITFLRVFGDDYVLQLELDPDIRLCRLVKGDEA